MVPSDRQMPIWPTNGKNQRQRGPDNTVGKELKSCVNLHALIVGTASLVTFLAVVRRNEVNLLIHLFGEAEG